jgi:hypothetical protein
MATTISATRHLPASPATVLELLGDEAFLRERAAVDSTLTGRLISVSRDGERVESVTEAAIPTNWLPSRVMARSPTLPTTRRRESWRPAPDHGYRADLRVDIIGAPGDCAGSITLTEREEGAHYHFQARLTVSVPIVGGAVEKLLASQITRVLNLELDLLARRLAG